MPATATPATEALTITRTETFRSEWLFTARRGTDVLSESRDFDIASAFRRSDQHLVQLVIA